MQQHKEYRHWLKYSAGQVIRDKVLFEQFKKDFIFVVGTTFEVGCNKCFDKQFNKFYSTILNENKMKSKTEYRLKKKYDGISLYGVLYCNPDLTDAKAKKLLKEHPAGANLFDRMPVVKEVVKKETPKEVVKKVVKKKSVKKAVKKTK